MKKTKILCLICARAGSKGVKNKNIKIFNSKPLIYWTIKDAKKISSIKKIYVSTDSKKIMSIANKYGAETPFLRPDKLAKDNSPEILSWRHALNFFYKKFNHLPKALLILPITSPTRNVKDVKKLINLFFKSKCDSAIAVTNSYRNPYFNMVKRSSKNDTKLVINSKIKFFRRQDAPKVYDMTTVAYVLNPVFILKNSNIFNGNVKSLIVEQKHSIDIDNNLDFKIAEILHKQK